MKKVIVVRKFKTEEIVKVLDVTGMSERKIERIESGLNINLDHANYYSEVVDETELG